MYNDPYYGMNILLSGHIIDDYNGIYTALDYFYVNPWGIESRYIHFKNNNDMFLYYLALEGETVGVWGLHDSEE